MAKTIEEELLEMKAKVDKAKVDKAQLEGEYKQAISQLRDAHEVDSVEKAKRLIEEKTAKVADLDEEAEKVTAELREAYDWGSV